ncbi:MAG TPA: site-2 protease family protein [Chloroflexota bacterium]|nr:site-2 protease family protein [Chloroflexota bacterium]
MVDLNSALQTIVILLVSITWHELAHALTATYLGDDTPRRTGHLSLNPFRHMDQYGILLVFISALVGSGFAYGFTPVNERNLRPNPKTGGGIVAVVGPLSNFLLAILLAIPLRFYLANLDTNVADFLTRALLVNIFLGVFNLVPIPPLDGWRVLATFLSPRTLYDWRNFVQYGPAILLGLFLLEGFFHFFHWLDVTFVEPIARFLLGL